MTKIIQTTQYDVIVAGGGASGMMAACFCAARGKKVALLEKNKKLGRKLSATGNGKCNLSNLSIGIENYPEADSTFVEQLLKEYSTKVCLDWFRQIGIVCKSKNGYLYPLSEQAQSVASALENELIRNRVDIIKNCEIHSAKKQKGLFVLDTTIVVEDENAKKRTIISSEDVSFTANKLILSLGGPAAPVYGADMVGTEILKSFGHTVIKPAPALVPLLVKEKIVKQLAGVRLDAKIDLCVSDKHYREEGEIIFAQDGVSGIPVFQLSRYASKNDCRNCKLTIDLIPAMKGEELKSFLLQLSKRNPGTSLEYLFRGILNYKAVYYIMLENGFDPERTAGGLSEAEADKLSKIFKKFSLEVTGTKGFENAQTSTGGIPVNEVNEKLESKFVENLYVTGELLDVDGNCGGYNLHFAWATGMRAGKAGGE